MMPKKYISLEAAITAIGKPKVTPGGVIFDALKKACQEEVRNLPAADVVEVIRCRECEFTYAWHGRLYCKRLRNRWNHVNDLRVDDTDFCTWGKRKDGGQNE